MPTIKSANSIQIKFDIFKALRFKAIKTENSQCRRSNQRIRRKNAVDYWLVRTASCDENLIKFCSLYHVTSLCLAAKFHKTKQTRKVFSALYRFEQRTISYVRNQAAINLPACFIALASSFSHSSVAFEAKASISGTKAVESFMWSSSGCLLSFTEFKNKDFLIHSTIVQSWNELSRKITLNANTVRFNAWLPPTLLLPNIFLFTNKQENQRLVPCTYVQPNLFVFRCDSLDFLQTKAISVSCYCC